MRSELTRRSATPWYSTMRLFRQSEDRGWESVVDRIVRVLLDGDETTGLSVPWPVTVP
jgi:hypothetical protein